MSNDYIDIVKAINNEVIEKTKFKRVISTIYKYLPIFNTIIAISALIISIIALFK